MSENAFVVHCNPLCGTHVIVLLPRSPRAYSRVRLPSRTHQVRLLCVFSAVALQHHDVILLFFAQTFLYVLINYVRFVSVMFVASAVVSVK